MRTELELMQDFLVLPFVNVDESTLGVFAKGDEMQESIDFLLDNGDLRVNGNVEFSANGKVSYCMDYEIGIIAAFCISKTIENHLVFSAYDSNEYRPVIKNNNVVALEVLIAFEGTTKIFYFRNVNNLPFFDIQDCKLIDAIAMQA